MKMVQRSHVGKVRDHNEDCVGLYQANGGVVIGVVADGLGGHNAGEIASQETVQIMKENLGSLPPGLSTQSKIDELSTAIEKANKRVYDLANKNGKLQGMGCTVVTVIAEEDLLVIAHVGDSRAYLLHKGGLYQLTEDHSFVNILRKHGQITEEEARNHPKRNMIVRAVGTNESVEVDLIDTPWREGDIMLLCSDGLTSMVSDREIGLVLTSSQLNMEEKADRLIDLALDAGGADNISLILLEHVQRSTKS
ncbi:Serine/threonine protein phosphatase PrpC [Seinonella peptonophila]|uniref:Serine/threonine protein phosphatase PrpC n=1 Tax=Seinonella peptonophila TaxID=112248 RepID=A0A1M4UVS9_9BACL|nr:Stp1/IreP family PP2C-type Ser/Thr phosphatase [Seinonella peptonophila]SHE60747.1 Serine/threonine protein phosphatase PrpC [Seinonella peptonophila]